MRIGITCYPSLGGSGVLASELGRELSRRHEVHFITYDRPPRLEGTDIPFHKVSVLPYPLFVYPPYTMALASKMKEVAEAENLDILNVHYAIPHAVAAYLAKKMLKDRIKVLTTLHGSDVYMIGPEPAYKDSTSFAVEQSDGITAVSEFLKKAAQTMLGIRKEIDVIYNFVDPARYFHNPHEGLMVTHISNFRKVKRIPDVITTFCKLTREVDACLCLVGDGPEIQTALELVKKYNLQDRTHFCGGIPEVGDILSRTDVFLLPSETESFGLAALEAMASSVPVIASRVGGLPEVIDHEENGFLCEVGDTDCMAAYAVDVLKDDGLRKEIGQKAREKVEKHFSAEAVVPKYEKNMEKLLNKKEKI